MNHDKIYLVTGKARLPKFPTIFETNLMPMKSDEHALEFAKRQYHLASIKKDKRAMRHWTKVIEHENANIVFTYDLERLAKSYWL